MAAKTGVLLINLGTPQAPEPAPVRRYLRQFLSDPRVLDIPAPARAALLNLVILPTRPAKSAEAYAQVWTDEGSPLLVFSQRFCDGVAKRLPDAEVCLAMRYGEPSIAAGMAALRAAGCDELVVFPLYPQYASSSTGSSLEAVYRAAASEWNTPYLRVVPPFYEEPGFVRAFAATAAPVLGDLKPQKVVLSYHGLPERHCTKSDERGGHCLASAECCASIVAANRNCYRAHCFATSRALIRELGLDEADVLTTFQSRLGRTPWVQPYTDVELPKLAQAGVQRVAVLCPSFVADCLETLEEIGIRAREDFQAAGGKRLELVPSLNDSPAWVDAAVELARRQFPAAAAE